MSKVLDDVTKDNHKNAEERDDIQTLGDEMPADPRAEAMANMVKNSADARDESQKDFMGTNGYNDDPVNQNTDDDLVEPIEEKAEEPVDKEDATTDTSVIERDGNQFLKLNVNGKDVEMPVSAAIGAIQKNENADQKIWEATQTKKKYDDLIAQHTETATPPDASQEIAVDTQEALKDALTKVYDGDVTEAAEVLGKVLRPRQESNPVNVKAQIAETVAEMEDHRNLRSAYDTFMADDEFSNITNDPELLGRVNTFTEALQRDSEFLATKPSYTDFFKEAGRRTQSWIDKISGTTKASPQQNVDPRLERKRTTPKAPESRTVRRGPKVEAPAYSSREDIIKKMAERRGQTNL